MRAHQAVRGETDALSKLSEAEYHTRLILEERKDDLLTEAWFELEVQELRVESAEKRSSRGSYEKPSRNGRI